MLRHYNIPVFIPELACPHRCVFCNQNRITNEHTIPKAQDIKALIKRYLATIPKDSSHIQIAFFGGTFTALPRNVQNEYLQVAHGFKQINIQGIRISTRPDYIDEETLVNLKSYGVQNIELGAQSMDEKVLQMSGRGHTTEQTRKASKLIVDKGFTLGLQMMIGLPGDTLEKSLATAKEIVEMGAKETRIYPNLVLRDTPLEKLWKQGKYQALGLKEAVNQSAILYHYFVKNEVKVLRTGLYPSEDFVLGDGFLAGPFHPQFKELVLSEIWRQQLAKTFQKNRSYILRVPKGAMNHVFGFKKSNRKFFEQQLTHFTVQEDMNLKNFEYHVDYSG